jgi:Fe-S-cluster-containing dehydrogenase component/anaerobic selenocysteine-containing dehydrogenase
MHDDRQRRRDRWRSLAELAGVIDPEAAREFAPGVDEPPTVGRRDLGKLLGASMMLAGASACTRAPRGRIVAYGQQPEQTPGVAKSYATTMSIAGYGTGLLIEEHEGRPTKIEGNPDHPASLGASGVFEQAALLSLYDPDRLRGVREGAETRSLEAFARALTKGADDPRSASLAGIHLLLESTTSPQIEAALASLEQRGVVVHFHDALSRSNVWEGTRQVFGQPLEPLYDLAAADVVLGLDTDLLASEPFHLRHARGFADRRGAALTAGSSREPSRLYVVEPALTVTGSVADHRLRSTRRDIASVAIAVLRETVKGLASPPAWLDRVRPLLAASRETDDVRRWAAIVARDLVAHSGRALVAVGEAQPASVHAIAQLTNLALGAVGATVRYVRSPVIHAGQVGSGLASLLESADRGEVDTLVMVGGNPSYTAPADLEFARRIRRIPRRMYLTQYENETARDATWLVPAAHFLEGWEDARALDGTVSFTQPMIEPLYDGRTTSQVLALLAGDPQPDAHHLLMRHWQSRLERFEVAWPEALQRGLLVGSQAATFALDREVLERAIDWAVPVIDDRLELAFRADAHVRDGGFANNAWLQELPDPITKLTWGNAACVSAATAERLGLESEDVVGINLEGREVRGPLLIVPGQADGTVSVSLGFGRQGAEGIARGVGFDAYGLRTSGALWSASGVAIVKTGDRASLAITQEHGSMEGRPIALAATIAELRSDPKRFAERNSESLTLYRLRPAGTQQWAMAIDLDICTGCSACVVACQAENNVPVVGKEGVEKGRAMHWLRIDRYFEGTSAEPALHHQPMACQHCEKAPCEYVCPVGATVHSEDGLNEMVYNRCVGTRFCSNNCPYKVRRFNWFDYNRDKPETLRMAMNPDVTVRARGVMEKCTYCVQRIRETEIRSHTGGLPIRDGDVRTACEQACPTRAITFGSIADHDSRVSALHRDPRAYAVLHELGTEPRTRYLARITNPNPELGT